MAKPPGDNSSWFHHSDLFSLPNPDGRTWLEVCIPVAGGQLDVLVPVLRDPCTLSYVMSLSADGRAKVTCDFRHAGAGGGPVAWSVDTPPEHLLPRERRVRARSTHIASAPDGPVVAQVHAESGGRLWFTDADLRARLELRLHRQGAPPPSGMRQVAALTRERVPIVDVFALDDERFPVKSAQASPP